MENHAEKWEAEDRAYTTHREGLRSLDRLERIVGDLRAAVAAGEWIDTDTADAMDQAVLDVWDQSVRLYRRAMMGQRIG